jgi:protein SCO1/2
MSLGTRTILYVVQLLLLAALSFSARAAAQDNSPFPAWKGQIPPANTGGDFRLSDQHGQPLSLERLRGRYVLLFFGYTHCPDVCPTVLAEARAMNATLARDEKPVVLFVTLDPARDTPELLRHYLAAFDPAFLGAWGDIGEIDRVAAAYRVGVKRHAPRSQPDASRIDHSAYTYLLNPRGQVVLMYPFGALYADVLDDLRAVRRLAGAGQKSEYATQRSPVIHESKLKDGDVQ